MIAFIKVVSNFIGVLAFWVAFFGFAWFFGKRGPVRFIDKTKYEYEKNIRFVALQNKHYSSFLKSLLLKIDIFLITLAYRRDLIFYWACISLALALVAKYIGENMSEYS